MWRLICCLFFLSISNFGWSGPLPIIVSIAPQKYLVERIGKERVAVDVIVPPGTSPHSYEPTVRQTIDLQKAVIWFRLGEGFEQQLMKVFKGKIAIVDQREGISLLPVSCHCQHNYDAHDSHIWLSPNLLKIEASQIAKTLCQHDPEGAPFYRAHLDDLLVELTALDQEILAKMKPLKQRALFVSHPAFGYFCRDYHLEQFSIEMDGKEATPRYLTHLLEEGKKRGIRTLFLQMQYNPKGGQRIAEMLGAETVFLDPYAEDVVSNLRTISEAFCQ